MYGTDVASGALTNATAIGYNAIVNANNTIQLGNTSVTSLNTSGVLTTGTVTYPNVHNSTAGQVLTTNANGVVSFATPSAGVPYTGATGAVDLGAYDLTVNGLKIGKGPGSTYSNTAIGNYTLVSNTTGYNNTAIGSSTLVSNTTGGNNIAIGSGSLVSNTTGSGNTANGGAALFLSTTGNYNTANGFQTLVNNTTGSYNAAFGLSALGSNTTGSYNAAFGFAANVASGALTIAL